MDLWIRSQDKRILTPITSYIIEINNSLYYLGMPLADYKTKERALEVLDEIQNALLNKWADNVKYEEHYDNEKPRTMVYEMPKE